MVKVDDIVQLPKIIQHFALLTPQVNVYFESLYFKDEFHGNQVATLERLPKVSDFSYNECYILHLHTRSLRSLIIKSLQATFERKRLRQLAPVLDLLRNDHEFEDTQFLSQFRIRARPKSELPYVHATKIGNVNKQLLNHRLYTSNYSLIDFKKEEAILLEVLKSVNVSFSDFVKFENRLVKIVFDQKTFHLPNIQNKS